jgi:hypothetical protein
MIYLESPRRMAIHGHARHVPLCPRDVYMSVVNAIMGKFGVLGIRFRLTKVSRDTELAGVCFRIGIEGLISSN